MMDLLAVMDGTAAGSQPAPSPVVVAPRGEPGLTPGRYRGAPDLLRRRAPPPARGRAARAIEAIAYRIAQEALTNAIKHAPGAHLEVGVALAGDELTITFRNDAVAAPSPIAHTGSGLGLAGMRERLAALDGSLTAGAEADGGFRLQARLPLVARLG
jgi:hypothetical protein